MKDDVYIGLLFPDYYKFYAHEVVEGMIEYAANHPHLHLVDLRFSDIKDVPSLLKQPHLDALIVGLTYHNYQTIGCHLPHCLPIVNLHPDILCKEIPSVAVNLARAANTAFTYIYEQGYRSIGYLCAANSPSSLKISEILKDIAVCKKLSFSCFEHKPGPQHSHKGIEPSSKDLDKWVLSLLSPVGIIAGGGFTASFLSRTAKRLGICVPGELAIVSLSDDEVCLFADPPISCLRSMGVAIGQKGLIVIDKMLSNESVSQNMFIVSEGDIIERRSTGFPAGMPDDLKLAVRYIRGNACNGITVADVITQVRTISRTTLYKQFKHFFGRSPASEIFRIKIEHSKYLLMTTNLTITEIAYSCGFSSQAHFSLAFSRYVGFTPTLFRKQIN